LETRAALPWRAGISIISLLQLLSVDDPNPAC